MIFKPQGVCAEEIHFDIENGIVKDIKFVRGCPGNAIGVANLAQGRKLQEVIEVLEGVKCGSKETSCPDQLAQALKAHL